MPDLPRSTALSEATARESWEELMSRDPEGYQQGDLEGVIIPGMRAMRKRLEAAEAAGVKAPKQPKSKAPLLTQTSASLDDLGL